MRVGFILIYFLSFFISSAQSNPWVDSVYNQMELSEKISQLFMVPISTYVSDRQLEDWIDFIKEYQPGSIYITRGGPKSHISVVNALQKNSKIPLLVGMNAEWGLGQTLDSTMQFPKPIVIGANADNDLVNELGYQIGLQMRSIGAHINFTPNADINVPLTSLVTNRYLGSDKIDVANKSIAIAEGLRQANVIAVAKHIPGILPEPHEDDQQSLLQVGPDSISFYPYQKLIEKNIGGILTTHLHFSTRENNKLVPAPVSQIFISEMIKNQTRFRGLAFTEISYLKTITNKGGGETEKIAFEVGNDILIDPENIRGAIKRISRLVKRDEAMMTQLEVSVKKILQIKYDIGLSTEKLVDPSNLDQKLFSPTARLVDQKLKEGAVTLINNTGGLVPVERLEDSRKFSFIHVGSDFDGLEHSLNRYIPFESFRAKAIGDLPDIEKKLPGTHLLIIAVSSVSQDLFSWVSKISNQYSTIVCHFGNPSELQNLAGAAVLMEGYDIEATSNVVGEVIFGALPMQGKLPVTISQFLKAGRSIQTSTLERLTYTFPVAAEMDEYALVKIDSIVKEALDIGATPGARVMIARKGQVVFDKSYGWQSADKKIPVSEKTIYDMASVTKVTATLQAVMFLYERNLIDINKKISEYLPEFKKTNKKNIIIKDILTHQAGLWPYFPWHVDIMKDTSLVKRYFNKEQSEEFPFPVSENLFSHKSMRDSMWSWIVKSKMIERKDRTPYEYRYSDLGLYIMQRLVQKLTNQPLEDFVYQNFYEPIGAATTGFHPLERFPADEIAPTENDKDFRKSLLVGYVHDPGSAMFGGVAGHAGLFSNANDMMKMGQMWLQKGKYGGTQYFKPETIDLFTAKQYETSRRGLGWDKPTGDWNGSTGIYCSPLTFGHTGFTGTCIWVDPEFDLVFVFLSNRVNPEISGKLLSANIRTRIQDVIYQSMFRYSKSHGCPETN